jgi:DNA-binding IclR family transcriptional regulator
MKIGSKRRRTKQTIEDESLAALTKQQAIEEKLALFEKLKVENAQLKAQPETGSEAERVLSNMLQAGFVQREADGSWGPGPNAVTRGGQ